MRAPVFKWTPLRSQRRNIARQAECSDLTSILCDKLASNHLQCAEVLTQWLSQGNTLTPSSVSNIFERLTSLKHYRGALQVLKYVRESNAAELSTTNCIREITLTCRQHAPNVAEHIYCSLPPEMKTDEVTRAFVICLAKEKALGKAEIWLQHVKSVTPELLDAMMSVYFSRDMHDRVLSTYDSLRLSGLKPTMHTYLTLLKCKDRLGGLEEVEHETRGAILATDASTAEVTVLNHMMEACGYLGDSERVEELWRMIMSTTGVLQDSYSAGLAAFGLLGQVEKVENIIKEMMVQGNKLRPGSSPYFTLVEAYARLGMMEQAERVLREKTERKVFRPYNALICGYLARSETDRALVKLEEGSELENGEVVPAYKTVMGLLPVFAARQDVLSAEKLVRQYRKRGDTRLFNELLNVYSSSQQAPNWKVLDRIAR